MAKPPTTTRPSTLEILLADDNPEVRAMLAETLRSLGHRVTAAADGAEALALWQAHEGRFDVVVSDFSMPRMDGLQLAAGIQASEPAAAAVGFVIVSSRAAELKRSGPPEPIYLSKPFSRRRLAAALERALQAPLQPRSAAPEPPAVPQTVPLAVPTTVPPTAHRLSAARSRGRLAPWQWAAAAALVAAVGTAGLLLRPSAPNLPAAAPHSVSRSTAILGLSPNGAIGAIPATLQWNAIDGAVAYRTTLYGVDETILWQQGTAATTVALPAEVRAQLHGGVSYLWRVEALSPAGGRRAAAELSRFEIAVGAEAGTAARTSPEEEKKAGEEIAAHAGGVSYTAP
jgi:CheY-like chemotaxis protein